MTPFRLTTLLLLGAILVAAGGCSGESAPSTADHEAPAEAGPADEFARGVHGGRLLRDGDFALELQIVEHGVPPEFHVWLSRGDAPVAPEASRVQVELTRLGGARQRYDFAPRGDRLIGDAVVAEPHSFVVVVTADENGRQHRWQFDSFEGRVTIDPRLAADAGIAVAPARAAILVERLELSGRVVPDAEYQRAVGARFAGSIRSVGRSVGDRVRRGEVLATVESDDSLQTYAITAPIDGQVIERHANPGEQAGESPLFVIADHRRLWIELALFPRDLARVRVGQEVAIDSVDGDLQGRARILRIAPAEGAAHGSASGVYTARLALANGDAAWTPGRFVRGRVELARREVPLAVPRGALQRWRDRDVVFERVGDVYEVRVLDLGAQDETVAQVRGGLGAGAAVVVANSYLVKADLEKSGASHEH